jgi:hypothetical protein
MPLARPPTARPEQALLLGDVVQLVLDAVAAVAGVEHAPDHHEVLAQHAPGREADLEPRVGRSPMLSTPAT